MFFALDPLRQRHCEEAEGRRSNLAPYACVSEARLLDGVYPWARRRPDPRARNDACSVLIVVVIATAGEDDRAGLRVEDQLAVVVVAAAVEIEHVVDLARDGVERAARLDALAGQPVVLDEAQDRALVGQRVVDVVAPGERRDHQERLTGAVAAAAPRGLAAGAGERRCRRRTSPLQAVIADADGGERIAGRVWRRGPHR